MHPSPRIDVIRNFLTGEECEAIIELATPGLAASTVEHDGTGSSTPEALEYRGSRTAWLARWCFNDSLLHTACDSDGCRCE